ncbi:TadE/TadG family type IV pilus assembly protein [Sandaracinus amylolyticus]|uniref:TadE/TadG family type IV pilus assembly protein n=1 Tax=Sandaracinus amylolyticus TaxID=927083 RepID=UPI001F428951|nr:TadE family protein [Sandaracinus amylolyticus]UJR83802.1 Hypothetical protein I5071_58730 [Sandaracinus amylolyticus]
MRVRHDERGAVYAEIAIAILPLFTLVMGVAQLALIAQASLVVRHAAQSAVRSAVVVLDDDESYYGGSPRLMIEDDAPPGALTAVVTAMSGSPGGLPAASRLGTIRTAAFRPLLGIAPGPSQVASGRAARSIRHAIGGASNDRLAFAVIYLDAAAAVTFPETPGSSSLRTSFAPDEPITARVTMAYPCLVPLVAELLCDEFDALDTSDLSYAARPGALSGVLDGNVRYRLIQAEATLTNQGAPYPYP